MTEPPPFLSQQAWEDNGVFGIAFGEASGLARHAIKPFEADGTHPNRSARPFTGKEVDRRADTQSNFRRQAVAIFVNPKLLLRRA